MSRRANRRKPLTDAQREQRRDEDRQRMQAAAAALLTSDGWQRWIRVRSQNGLARYSVVISGRRRQRRCPWRARTSMTCRRRTAVVAFRPGGQHG